MMRRGSIKRPLILFPLLFQFAILFVSFAVLLTMAVRLDSGGPYTDETITPIIAHAIVRRPDGGLAIRQTPQFGDLQATSPDLWFVAEDDAGHSLTFGNVPEAYSGFIRRLSALSYAQVRDRTAPYDLAAVVRREVGPAGPLSILGHGKLNELSFIVLMASNVVLLPIFLLLSLTSLFVTPWIVRRSLAGVTRVAKEAEQIDSDRRGRRLSEAHVPEEIAPLVMAVNAALRRLDDGYERQRRFIASAAHELRTPIAVLAAKVEISADSGAKSLANDVARLATLAEQLLDLQRLDTDPTDEAFDLGVLVRRIVADLAPLLIASEKSIDFNVLASGRGRGDVAALERVVINLVQNAIEHGGQHVSVRVDGLTLEVEDDGPGIPREERDRVFEPFHRLRPRSTGSGLGLNLVQQVVERHGGRATILSSDAGGTIARIVLPAVS